MAVLTSSSERSQDRRTSLHPLHAPVLDQTPAHRLLLGLEQAGMAMRLGLDAKPITVGRFVLERLVGRGGMGMVFAARDPALERIVALKILAFDSARARELAMAEARALARLSHPNVVTVFEVGVEGELTHVAMELVRGQSLREWLGVRPRTLVELIPVFVAAGRGLAAAHVEGLVHRDFKPDNVLIGVDGRVRVIDFGLARTLDGDGEDVEVDARAGTPAYMAPERLRGEPATPAADQFEFCVSLWEACCGERPFCARSLARLAAGVAEAPQIPAGIELPLALIRVLEVGLAAAPAQRWPDLHTLLDALERLGSPSVPIVSS